jgi:hypothetical protein
MSAAANGTNSTGSSTGSGSSKKNAAMEGTIPRMDALVIVAMAAILNAMAGAL